MEASSQLPSIPFTHSLAFIREGETVITDGNMREIFPLASVTKVLTAWATLIAVDRGYLGLDDPAGPPGATLRHLLSHASGLPYESRDPQLGVEQRRIYSNAGIEIVGETVAQATGMDFSQWLDVTLCEPLGLADTSCEGSPAYAGKSSAADLITLVHELASPQLISTALWEEATRSQFPELAGIVPGYGRQNPCPWGLGVEIRGEKSPHWTAGASSPRTFGHFGVAGSFIWMDPVNDCAGVFLGEDDFGPWHKENWHPLNDAFLQLPAHM